MGKDGSWVIWVIGIVQFVFIFLLGGNIYWIKKWMNKRESWEEKRDKRAEDFEKAGGIVTGHYLNERFREERIQCPLRESLSSIQGWRDGMSEKGGPLTIIDHLVHCDANSSQIKVEFKEQLADGLKHMKELFRSEFDGFKADMKNVILKEFQKEFKK